MDRCGPENTRPIDLRPSLIEMAQWPSVTRSHAQSPLRAISNFASAGLGQLSQATIHSVPFIHFDAIIVLLEAESFTES